mgnify:FL=1
MRTCHLHLENKSISGFTGNIKALRYTYNVMHPSDVIYNTNLINNLTAQPVCI